jgi:hypothetical protein
MLAAVILTGIALIATRSVTSSRGAASASEEADHEATIYHGVTACGASGGQ